MYPAAVGSKNLQNKETDERTDGNAPRKSFETVIASDDTAADNRKVIDDARQRRNRELLAGMLYGDEEAAGKDKELSRQNDSAEVCCAV